jgi:hypothetical protein
MKHNMLTTLNFDFTGYPSSYRFWERLVKIAKCNDTMKFLSQYLIEIPLIEIKMLKHKASVQAASSIYMAGIILYGDAFQWTDELVEASGNLTWQDLKNCTYDMERLL